MTRTRANGEGSIFPYRNGFAAYAWVTTPAGQARRKYVYGKTREIVHDKWIDLQQQARKGPVETRHPKLSEYLTYWMNEVVKPNLKPKTTDTYGMHVRLYIIPLIGEKRLNNKFNIRTVRSFLNKLATICQCCEQGKDASRIPSKQRCCAKGSCCQSTLSKRTLHDVRATLRAALSNAVAEDLIAKNPAVFKLPKVRRPKTKPWSVEEARAFLVSAREAHDPFYAAYVLILVLGLRKGEVLGLSWSDLDLDAGLLTPTHGLQRIGRQLVLGDVKTEDSETPLPLPEICIAALGLRRVSQDADMQLLDASWPDRHGFVFTTRTGAPVDPRNFNRSFARRCQLAGVRQIRVHDTRRTCATLLAALNVHPRVAMAILRHSKIATTMEIYTQVPSEDTQRALRQLADILDDTGAAE